MFIDENGQKPTHLRQRKTGTIYVYTDALAERGDMDPYNGKIEVDPTIGQDHLTVKQKVELGIELTEEDRLAYPHMAKVVAEKALQAKIGATVDAAINPAPAEKVADPAPVPAGDEAVEITVEALEAMSEDELRALAEENGIKVDGRWKAEKIREAIIAAASVETTE